MGLHVYIMSSHKPVPTEFIPAMPYHQSHSKLVLTKSFQLNLHILRNSNFTFQTNYFPFLHVATHKFYELCSYAYLYGQKGFEQGSIQGDLGIWGEFQFHMELIRGQL